MISRKRFGVSLPNELIEAFDALVQKRNIVNRSEAMAHLIRQNLVEESFTGSQKQMLCIISIIFDHTNRKTQEYLTTHQHSHHHQVISSLHIHLDHEHCLEVLIVQGIGNEIAQMHKELSAIKGVLHCKLTTAGVVGSFYE